MDYWPIEWDASRAIESSDWWAPRCDCPNQVLLRCEPVRHRRQLVATHVTCCGCGADWVWARP